jgi:hypothetical protein
MHVFSILKPSLSFQVIPVISSLTPVTTAVPLIGVLSLTAIKDAYDDIVRFSIILLFYCIVRSFACLEIMHAYCVPVSTSHPYNAWKLCTCILLSLPLSAYKNRTLTASICNVRVLSLTAIKDAYNDIVRFTIIL